MGTGEASTSEPADPPKKRSFFTKPSLPKAEKKIVIGGEDDLFNRSSQVVPDILSEQRRKKKEKQLRKRHKAQKESDERKSKRRRTSEDVHDDQDGQSKSSRSHKEADIEGRDQTPNTPNVMTRTASKSATPKQSPLKTLSARYEHLVASRTFPKKPVQSVSNVIDLGSDDSDDGSFPQGSSSSKDIFGNGKPLSPPKFTNHTSRPSQVVDDDEDDESDPELRAIASKARAAKRARELQNSGNDTGRSTPVSTTAINQFNTPPKTPLDPIIQILITSQIPNTTPLITTRKLSQNFSKVRKTWCDRQGFSQEMADSVFLTWKNRRLFDVGSCKSLGIQVDAFGSLSLNGGRDFLEEDDNKICVEAVTPAIYAENKRAAELAIQRLEEAPQEAEEEEVVVVEEVKPKGIRLYLKSRGYKDFKLMVKPDTTFASIANAFRKEFSVQDGKEVFLMFDGERLDPDMMMQDSEVDDTDSIEVHVK
ncbi:hypothetical protein M501DRAFT_1012126 [Patellaria atrata CBS 101060]|uniref:Ubiquitin-like domain-containing protein n=1 Tax=Patellaria atrata CBS 101060 TaxID=1346257 RepID=A0A9P4VRA4_9PEZI|nr:hypothetical protein M501DRAFT_1012126 [Patellaria atrata CBS 101060]